MMRRTRIYQVPRPRIAMPVGTKYLSGSRTLRNPYRIKRVRELWLVTSPNGALAAFCDRFSAHEYAVDRYRCTVVPTILERPEQLNALREATVLACSCPEGLPCHGDVLIELLSDNIDEPPQSQEPPNRVSALTERG